MSNFFNGGSSTGGTSFSSGGVTNNVIPKEDGSGGLKDSALTDNGTNVISTEMIFVPTAGGTATTATSIGGSASNGIDFASTTQMRFVVSGSRAAALTSSSDFVLGSSWVLGWSNTANDAVGTGRDTTIRKRSAANIALGGTDVNGSPVAQTLSVQNAVTGSDLAGSTFTIDAPLGTGLGAGAKTILNRALMRTTGTTAQTSANAFIIGESKTLSNTSATAQVIANIALASNSAGGAWVSVTVTATDGTNFDSETQSANISFVNKAGAITVGGPVITATSAANNSGSATIGLTAVANGNSIDIKVTPVFTTIVPTTVTSYITIMNNGAGAVTIS